MGPEFIIHEERLAFKRYLKLWHRRIEFPDGRIIDWDCIGEASPGPHFCVVFPYNSQTRKVRVIREYWQGINEMGYSLASGGFDEKKHKSIRECARFELLEEARLIISEENLIPLIEHRIDESLALNSTISDTTQVYGIAELKWSRNRFIPFVCIDAAEDKDMQGVLDEEELIHLEDMGLDEWNELILKGKVALPSVQTTLMALSYLRNNKVII
jgi:hypothetical protein